MRDKNTVTFRHIQHSTELAELVEQNAMKLRRRHECVQRCKVVIERPHRRHRHGNRTSVHVLVSLPGRRLFSPIQIKCTRTHTDPAAAVTAAFCALEQAVNAHVHRWDKPRTVARPAPRPGEEFFWTPSFDTSS